MEGLFLNLMNSAEMVSFLAQWSDWAPTKPKAKAEAFISAYDEGQDVDKAELAQGVKDLAIEIWPARFAITRFFAQEGALVEWDRMIQTVRRSTAHLMERFRQGTGCKSLDELLAHDEFDTAFREEERHEIEQVRQDLRLDYYRTHIQTLQPFVAEGLEIIDGCVERLESLRALSEGWPSLLAEELLNKAKSYEDAIFFKGQHVTLESLDEELAYYREQKELPIEE